MVNYIQKKSYSLNMWALMWRWTEMIQKVNPDISESPWKQRIATGPLDLFFLFFAIVNGSCTGLVPERNQHLQKSMRSSTHASLITQRTEHIIYVCLLAANHMVPTCLPNVETRHPVVFGHHDLELLSGDPEALAAKQSLHLNIFSQSLVRGTSIIPMQKPGQWQ